MKEDFRMNEDNLQEIRDMEDMEDRYFEREDGTRIYIKDIKPDPEILEMAREYDKKAALKKRQQRRKRFARVAALVVICVVTVSAVTLERSDALKLNIFRIFHNEEDGAATLLSEDEYDLIGDWEDYWYPTYMPEGYVLTAAEETETDKVMLFTLGRSEIRIIERPLDAAMNIDTDYTSVEEIEIEYHKGYLFTNEEYDFVAASWIIDDRQLNVEMRGDASQATLMKVVENLVDSQGNFQFANVTSTEKRD